MDLTTDRACIFFWPDDVNCHNEFKRVPTTRGGMFLENSTTLPRRTTDPHYEGMTQRES